MSERTATEIVVIPPWVVKLMAVLQPLVIGIGSWAVVEMRELRIQMTVLTVRMEYTSQVSEKLDGVATQVEINGNRISRLEASVERIEKSLVR